MCLWIIAGLYHVRGWEKHDEGVLVNRGSSERLKSTRVAFVAKLHPGIDDVTSDMVTLYLWPWDESAVSCSKTGEHIHTNIVYINTVSNCALIIKPAIQSQLNRGVKSTWKPSWVKVQIPYTESYKSPVPKQLE